MAQSEISRSDSCVQQQIYSESIHSVAQVIVGGVKMTTTVKEFEVHTSDGVVKNFILSIPSIETIAGPPPKPNRKRAASKSNDLLPSSCAQQKRRFSCHNCPKKFTSQSMLKRHVAIHNGSFCCPESGCESRYRNQTTLTKHQIAEHELKLSRSQVRGKRLAEVTCAENTSLPQSSSESSTMSPDNHSNESSPVGSIRSLTIYTTDEDSAGSMMESIASSSVSTEETKSPSIAEMKLDFALGNFDINSMDDGQFLKDNASLGELFQTDVFNGDLDNFTILTNANCVLFDDIQGN